MRKLLLLIPLLFILAFQSSPYARRIRPFASTPSSCQENEIGYNMTSHTLLICTGSSYVAVGGSGGSESPLTFSSPLSRSVNTISCPTCALTSGNLSQFASTTSAQLAGVLSDESGATGVFILGNFTSLTTSDVLQWNGTNWINGVVSSGGLGSGGNVNMTVANASSTGTTVNRLAKLTGAPSTALITSTSDTENAIGVVTSGAGTTGSATIAILGQVNCDFDNATTAGNYVTISAITAGKCHDAGSSYPTSGAAYGRVLTTNVSSGTYSMELMTPDIAFQNGGNGKSKPGTPANAFQYNSSNTFAGGNLFEEDANTISVRNSTNDQNFNVYRNYVSASNYQRIRVGWTSGAAEIMSEAATQTASNIILRVGSSNGFNFGNATLLPVNDATMSIGDSSHYLTEIYNNSFVTKTGGNIRFVGGSRISGPQKGLIKIIDDDGNSGSGTIQFDSRAYSISADTNNFDGIVPGYFQKWTVTGASHNLTGITFSNSVKSDGQVHLMVNVGAQNLVIKNEDTNSTAANRFHCSTGADITLVTDQAAEIIYDTSISRWRVFKRN